MATSHQNRFQSQVNMHLKILHITDIHIDEPSAGHIKERVKALIASLTAESFKPDLLVVTGDLAYRGTPNEYNIFWQDVLTPLMSEVGIPPSRCAVVPGNHDVDRSKIERLSQAGLKEYINRPADMDDLWRDAERRKVLTVRQDAFFSFASKNGLQASSQTHDLNGTSIGIACINSSWLASGNSDRSNLAITRAQVDASYVEISSSDFRLALWHHPLSWLNDSDAGRVRAQLMDKFHLCLTGHLHEEDGSQISSPEGNTIIIASPALFATGDEGGYMLYDIDLSARQISAIGFRWNERTARFVRNTDFAPNGYWSRAYTVGDALPEKALTIRRKASSAHHGNCAERLGRHLPAITVGKKELSIEERFLEPNLVITSSPREKHIKLQELIQDKHSYIIEALPQSGKTALLERIGHKLTGLGSVAAVVDFSTIRNYKKGKQGLIDCLAGVLSISKESAKNIILGDVLLLVDNCVFDFGLPEWKLLAVWREDLPHLRIVAAGRYMPIPQSRDDLAGTWKWVTIRPLSVQSLRKEVGRLEKLGATGSPSNANIQTALSTIIEAELPRWPWVILLFFQITQKLGLSDLRTVEGLLRQYTELRIGGFESLGAERQKARTRMLRLLATEMIERQVHALATSEAVALFDEQFDKSGHEMDGRDLLNELLDTQLITENEDGVCFTFLVLQEYFHARHLHETLWSDFASLSIDEVIRKSGSLVLYAEMVEAPLLLRRCLELAETFHTRISPAELIESLAHLRLPSRGSSDEIIEKAKKAILTDEELEDYVGNKEINHKGSKERRVRAGSGGMPRLEQFIHTFSTSVAVMRGGSWIEKSLKRESISKVLDLAICILAEMTADEELIRAIASMQMNPDLRRKVTAIVNAILVLIIASMLAVLGAGQHLASSLAEMFVEERQDLQRLMLLMWYLEIGGKRGKEFVEDFVRSAENLFCVQLTTMWLTHKYVMSSSFGHSSKEEFEGLLRIAAREQQSRIAQINKPADGPEKTKIQIKDEAERIVQAAKNARDTRAPEDK